MPKPGEAFESYAFKFYPGAQKEREQFPKELLPKLLKILDDLALNPEKPPVPPTQIGQGKAGELFLYKHPNPPLEILYEINRKKQTLYFVHFAAPVVQLKQVFVSYSHKNTAWLERIKKCLAPLEDQGLIHVWMDSDIEVGANWLGQISKALRTANMAVLLITEDFLTSPFIQTVELKELLLQAAQENLKVIPVVVGKSITAFKDSPIGALQAANDPEKPLETLSEWERDRVLEEIHDKVKRIALAN